jgi:hypothetical protein
MNPVLRENLAVLFDEKHVLTIYFYLLIFLAPVEFGALYSQSLGEQMWRGSAILLKVCAIAALVLILYFALRLANQEYAPERFKPLEHWLYETRQPVRIVAGGREMALLVHVFCLMLLSAPLLIWAAATSHAPLASLVATLALIPFYAFCYGVWGLAASVVWGAERENREFIIRLFTFIVLAAALAIYLPLNPVVYLLAVIGGEEVAPPIGVAGSNWSADSVHFVFHFVLGGAGLMAHRYALRHFHEIKHRE